MNVCRDELRRRARRPRLVALDFNGAAVPAAQAVESDLAGAIDRLTPDEQALVAMRYGRDLTVEQIAGLLQVPEGTVKSRLHGTLQHLRVALDAERRREATR